MKSKLISSIVIILCVFIRCKESNVEKKDISKWFNKEIVLPNDSLIVNNQKFPNPLIKKIKILSLINGDCSVCYDELREWKEFIKEVDTGKVGFIFNIYTFNDLIAFEDMNRNTLKFKYPYFKDVGAKIKEINDFSDDKIYKTVLLDEFNKVILIGNPNVHPDIRKLYLNEIKKRMDN